MININAVTLAGPVASVKDRMFGDFGFLEMNIAAVRVKMDLKQKDPKTMAMIEPAKQARSAIMVGGRFKSKPDKKDSTKWWYEVSCYPSKIVFSDQEVPILNHGQVAGIVRSVSGNWVAVGCAYRNPKTETWGEYITWVLTQGPASHLTGRNILAVGSVRSKAGPEWRLHLAAEAVWSL